MNCLKTGIAKLGVKTRKMKRFNIGLMFALIFGVFSITSFAQTTGAIAVVDPYQFGNEKAGITRYIAAAKKLTAEFQTEDNELRALATKANNLEKEIQALSSSSSPVPADISKKVEERDSLARTFKFKKEDRDSRFNKRAGVIMGPINQEIGKALGEFLKTKGFSMILDASRLEQAGLILAFDQKYNATNEFIAFFNKRPATAASAK